MTTHKFHIDVYGEMENLSVTFGTNEEGAKEILEAIEKENRDGARFIDWGMEVVDGDVDSLDVPEAIEDFIESVKYFWEADDTDTVRCNDLLVDVLYACVDNCKDSMTP